MRRKHWLYLLTAMVVLCLLAGCGNNGTENPAPESVPEAAVSPDETPEESVEAEAAPQADEAESVQEGTAESVENSEVMGALVVYFSRIGEQYSVGYIEKGNTAIVAEMIAEKTGADVFEIVPAEDNYPTDNYRALTDMGLQEQKDNARPAIAGEIENFAAYDTIFLGYPIWWNDLPMILYTFLETHDFSGKTIVPFCTHGGSQMAGTEAKIRNTVTADAVLDGLAIAGTDAQNNPDRVRETVNNWLAGLGY